jgi:hypothetical protein
MKRLCATGLVAVLALAGFAVNAQQTPEERALAERLRRESAYAEIQRQELINLQKETAHAMQLHNNSFFERVYSDDFTGTSPSGTSLDKQALVNEVLSSNVKYSSFVVSDISVRIFQSTAVVTCLWSSRGTEKGASFFRQARVITVYLYGPGGWRAVAGQETQLPG